MANSAWARRVASGFGSGFSPWAPGTAGSLVGLALGTAFLLVSPALLWLAIALSILAGLWAISGATGVSFRGSHLDPGWVVIDEIAGQMLAMAGMPRFDFIWIMAAFLLFRAFDIAKPGPVGWADRQGGAFGIMADDLLAGLAAAMLLLVAGRMLR